VRRRAPRTLAATLERVSTDLAPASTLARLQAVWAQAVGATVATEAAPVSERAGTVTIACRSSVWAQELALMSDELLDRLAAALADRDERPPLQQLRFVVGNEAL
jgi:predicted nucleic acid-binding Zn ribbon protein